MKILILGTSNSILKTGWVPAFQAAWPEAVVVNRSIGGSVGAQFICEMHNDLTEFNYVIFDSVPNDEDSLRDVGDEAYFDNLLMQLLASISHRTKLIMLGFCLRKSMRRETWVYQHRRASAAALGAQFIDIRDIVAEFGPQLVPLGESLFESVAHPHYSISSAIGSVFGRLLAGGRYPFEHSAQDFREQFHCVDAASLVTEQAVVKRQNRLIDARFARLEPGDVLSFQREDLCVGFYLNVRNSAGQIELRGPDGVRAVALPYEAIDGFLAKFHSVAGGHLVRSVTLPDDGKACVELARFAFWSGVALKPAFPPIPGHDHLALYRDIKCAMGDRLHGRAI